MPTPIPTPLIFPFEPDGDSEVTEQWVYSTNVITGKTGREKRVPLVYIPRYVLGWTVKTMDRLETSRLHGMMWTETDNRWYVPRWPSARRITNVAGLTLSVDTVGSDFTAFHLAMVWRDSATFDFVTTGSVSPGTVPVTGTASFTWQVGDILVPLLVGSIQLTLQVDRAGESAVCGVTFTADVSASSEPPPGVGSIPLSFAGFEVLTELQSTQGAEEHWAIRAEMNGGVASAPFIVRPLDEKQITDAQFGWLATSRSEIALMKQFLARRKGRLIPVWVPTLTQELVVGADCPAGTSVLNIPNFKWDPYYVGDAARNKILVLAPLSTFVAQISAQAGSTFGLTANLPVSVPKGTTVALLKLYRLSDDTVTMSYLPGQTAATSELKFTEVPSEAPA